MIDGTVPCDRQQPRPQRSPPSLECMRPVPDAKESFLYEIFRNGRISHHGEDHGIGQSPETVVQIGHGLRLLVLQPSRERFIVLSAHFEREYQTWNHHAVITLMRITRHEMA